MAVRSGTTVKRYTQGTRPDTMPRSDTRVISIPSRRPFDQFKGIHLLATDRRGHVSIDHARHRLYVGRDKQSQVDVLIKIHRGRG